MFTIFILSGSYLFQDKTIKMWPIVSSSCNSFPFKKCFAMSLLTKARFIVYLNFYELINGRSAHVFCASSWSGRQSGATLYYKDKRLDDFFLKIYYVFNKFFLDNKFIFALVIIKCLLIKNKIMMLNFFHHTLFRKLICNFKGVNMFNAYKDET